LEAKLAAHEAEKRRLKAVEAAAASALAELDDLLDGVAGETVDANGGVGLRRYAERG
jgi:hypothetical protein